MDIKYIFLLAATVVFWLITRLARKKKGLHNVLVVLFTVFVTFVVIETVYRFFLKKNPFTIKSNKNFGAYSSHPLTGFMIAEAGEMQVAKVSLSGDTIFSTSYNLIPDSGSNSIAMNHRSAFRSTSNDSAELVFLGCSITYGEGIRDHETFAYKAGEISNTSSLNFGFSGFGTHQAYNIYLNKFAKLTDKKNRSFIYSFIPDHILRAKCIYPWNINDPYFDVKGDSLALKGKASDVSGFAKTNKYTKYLSLMNSFTFINDITTSIVSAKAAKELSDVDYKRVFLMLSNMQQSISANNNKLIVIYWDKYKWKEADDSKVLDKAAIEKDMETLKQKGVTIIKASEVFDINNTNFFIKGDGHPTANANELIAERIVKEVSGK